MMGNEVRHLACVSGQWREDDGMVSLAGEPALPLVSCFGKPNSCKEPR